MGHVGHNTMILDLSVIEPPYQDESILFGREPALGSVAVGVVTAARGVPGDFPALLERSPWVVPCIAMAPDVVTPATLQSIWSVPGQPAFLVTPQSTNRLDPATILAAVRHRPPPPASFVVAYVVRRTGSVVLGQTLDEIWNPAQPPVRSAERTVRHRFRRLGEYTRHDWQRIWRLIRAKTEGADLGVDQRARLVGTESRTLRTWIRRYLGTSMKGFCVTAGWEWVIEAALRSGRFVRAGGPDVSWSSAAAAISAPRAALHR